MEDILHHLLAGLSNPWRNLIIIGLSVAIGLLVRFLTFLTYSIVKKNKRFILLKSILQRLWLPLALLMPIYFLVDNHDILSPSYGYYFISKKLLEILNTASICFMLIRIIRVLVDSVYLYYHLDKLEEIKVRKIQTQIQFIARVFTILIVFIGVLVVLLSFPQFHDYVKYATAYLGIIGIAFSLIAQKPLGNFIAGSQIALTQPMRINDVLEIEGQFGRVEEINLTYVTIRLWDKRTLVVPINYFIEKPFMNWTRDSAEVIGSVFLYLDYDTPIEALRTELLRLVQFNPLWDGKLATMQVVHVTEKSMEVRILVSALNAEDAFDLRCFVREHLIDFMRQHYPDCLPKNRNVSKLTSMN